jgi:hypothetical protein
MTLDIGVDILFGRIQSKLSLPIKCLDFPQSPEDFLSILLREDALSTKHKDVGSISPEIVGDEPFIAGSNPLDISPGKKIDHFPRGKFFKPSTP